MIILEKLAVLWCVQFCVNTSGLCGRLCTEGFGFRWKTRPFGNLLPPWTPSDGAKKNNGCLDIHVNWCKNCKAPRLGRGCRKIVGRVSIHIRLGEALPTTLEAPVMMHEAALLILWVEPRPQPCCLLEQCKLCVTWPWPKLKRIVRNDGEETREGWRKRTKIGVNKRQNRSGGWERGSDGICTVQMISMKVKRHNRLGHQLRVCIMSHTSY